MARSPETIGNHLYAAVLLPFDRQMKVDEQPYRRFLRHFLDNEKFVRMGGGICVNPEAGEIFYLSRQEKRRVLEIAMEEIRGQVPVIAGTWALSTDEQVERARDCKALGVAGIFVTPPGGAQDVTSCWDADNYPEVWLDQIIAQDRAVDLPIVTHPVGGAKPPFYPGLPLQATLRICREVPNVVGWKMTYMTGSGSSRTDYADSIVTSPSWGRSLRGSMSTRRPGISTARSRASGILRSSRCWIISKPGIGRTSTGHARSGIGDLVQLQEYVADMGRLHVRYKTATWLRGLIPNPFMRSPMPKPRQDEIDTLYQLLKNLDLPVIGSKEIRLAA
jgi:4-hydroxy-tetrahydrodipicolinate synthase